jgi:Ca-activated chloride channel family protein
MAGAAGGQKALLVFSDGEDNSSAHHMMDAIEAAQKENVRVYGLRYTESKHGRLTARNKYGIRVMERVARETGAADYDAREGDLAAWLREIREELRSSYDLAYPSTNPTRDGSFRKITVRAKRAGMVVRAKPGYFAEPSS